MSTFSLQSISKALQSAIQKTQQKVQQAKQTVKRMFSTPETKATAIGAGLGGVIGSLTPIPGDELFLASIGGAAGRTLGKALIGSLVGGGLSKPSSVQSYSPSGVGVVEKGQSVFSGLASTPPPSQPVSVVSTTPTKSTTNLPIGSFQTTTSVGTTATTPSVAPLPSSKPPTPTLSTSRSSSASIGGGGTGVPIVAPEESSLPPTPTLPIEITRPVGQFEAMIKALQTLQNSRLIQTPFAGAASFGPSPAQERALRRLRERELERLRIKL